MSTNQRIAVAVGVFLLLAVLAVFGGWHGGRQPTSSPPDRAVTVSVTSAEDRGPGTLREALFIVAAANGKATVSVKTKTIALKTALPPVVNSHGVRIVGEPGAEIDAQGLAGGPVFDVSAANTSLEGFVVRNCAGTAVLLRAAHFHLQSTTIESCEVGVDVAANASEVLIEHNRFANDRVGVRFAAASRNAAVVSNSFLHAKVAGLWAVRGDAAAGGGTISVRENHFNGNGSGVVAGNVAVIVERNDFVDAGEAAVHLVGSDAVVRGNHISGGTAMGIIAENASGAIIDDNELDHFTAYAIMLRGTADALVRANRVHNCGYGMAFVLGDPRRPSTAVDNIIIEPKFNGVDVIGDSPILRRNQVLRPHAFALYVADHQQPAGQLARARPVLEDNNFRADAIRVVSDTQPREPQRRP